MIYTCQQYDINRLCRFDRRAIDRGCDGCLRTTDKDYLTDQGLWIAGISHQEDDPGATDESKLEWRRIETAEKIMGAEVLLYDKKKGGVSIGAWWLEAGWHRSIGFAQLNPTHWMPLPEPPAKPE